MRLSAPIFRLKRQARLLSRETQTPLHAALDAVAATEGYKNWSHLSASCAKARPAERLLAQFEPGDFVLLGARPGHGKTALALELTAEAVRSGRRAHVFSLDETASAIAALLRGAGVSLDKADGHLSVDTSDDICAEYIVDEVAKTSKPDLIIIDYLQLLDQRRQNPPLAQQVDVLATFARSAKTIIVVISQIDRTFDPDASGLPGLQDVRLPNPVDLLRFTKFCFLHDGRIEVGPVN